MIRESLDVRLHIVFYLINRIVDNINIDIYGSKLVDNRGVS